MSAPVGAGTHDWDEDGRLDDDDPRHGVGDRGPEQEGAEQVGGRGQRDGRQRFRSTAGDECGHGVGRVMEPIAQRECEGHEDGGDQDQVHSNLRQRRSAAGVRRIVWQGRAAARLRCGGEP